MATAFELTRPEHEGRYHVTVYQQGWRLGGKGASGRGPAGRIEEHGLHLWLGYYDNAFRLLRECYAELGRDSDTSPMADWRDAIYPEKQVGLADRSPDGSWSSWVASFPPIPGEPGDPPDGSGMYSVQSYMLRTSQLIVSLLASIQERQADVTSDAPPSIFPDIGEGGLSPEAIVDTIGRFLRYGGVATLAAVNQAAQLLADVCKSIPGLPTSPALRLIDAVSSGAEGLLKNAINTDPETRRLWEIIDLALAGLRGSIRFGLATDPKGFDAINDYEMREWLRLNGASDATLNSAFVRGLYDLGFAYENGDLSRPAIAAGVGLRGTMRMLFTYKGSLFWKMRAGMGDVVFAPLYEVLKRRGVSFKYFHRLDSVRLVDADRLEPDEKPYVDSLEFDVQANIDGGGEYEPLFDVGGLPCWPSEPDYGQLVDGERIKQEEWKFESHWDRRKAGTQVLRVGEDFDFVVLGVSLGAIPHVCKDILDRDARWRAMVQKVKTVATQAFQLWLREDMRQLGWEKGPISLSGYVKPFDTWADMTQVIEAESWREDPQAIAYFCSTLATPANSQDMAASECPEQLRAAVRENAIAFLKKDIAALWPQANHTPKGFRWELLMDAADPGKLPDDADESTFDSQFWTANVNPTDRYVLSVPGSPRYRISPLDNTYDNLTIAGDWTDCGHNMGCVEAAVMSGLLAAHALCKSPALEDIVGYDHP